MDDLQAPDAQPLGDLGGPDQLVHVHLPTHSPGRYGGPARAGRMACVVLYACPDVSTTAYLSPQERALWRGRRFSDVPRRCCDRPASGEREDGLDLDE
jgi:hypothetical protein